VPASVRKMPLRWIEKKSDGLSTIGFALNVGCA